ncbi:MAG TPA: DPP IV N-terminal domain-containing protein, partial [Draconibacterium sp.]|nr:DPP IV N-terminal domain-containing protein [Draconibacterium sp.]
MKFNLSTLFLLAFLLISSASFAQNEPITKANYRLAERFSPEKLKKMVFSTSVDPNWLETGDKFWYSYETSEGTFFYLVNLDKKTKTPLFDNDKMAAMITRITQDPYDGQHLPPIKPKFKKGDTVFQFDVTSSQDEEVDTTANEEKQDSVKVTSEKKEKPKKKVFHFEYNLQTGELYEQQDWKETKEHPEWASMSPDSSFVVFARDYNLFWMDKENYLKALEETEDKTDSTIVEHQLTSEGVKDYEFGGGYTAKENDDEETIEKERKKRQSAWIFWSPDSKKFALVREDNRKVKALWVIDVLKEPRPELETYKYEMPGEKNIPQDELWVFDMVKKEGKQIIDTTFTDQSIMISRANLTNKERIKDYVPRMWLSKSSDKLYYSRTSRDLHKIDVCVA